MLRSSAAGTATARACEQAHPVSVGLPRRYEVPGSGIPAQGCLGIPRVWMCAYGSELYDPSWHAWVVIR